MTPRRLVGQRLRRFAGEGCHVVHVYPRFFRDGEREGFRRGVHGRNDFSLPDGALGEHVGLALQIAVLVDHFQRAEQIIRGILRERKAVAPRVDEAVFRGKSVIEPVQAPLVCF